MNDPQYPEGQLSQDDQGAVSVLIAADHSAGVVRIKYGEPVVWLALEPAYVRQFAALLLTKADELDPPTRHQ